MLEKKRLKLLRKAFWNWDCYARQTSEHLAELQEWKWQWDEEVEDEGVCQKAENWPNIPLQEKFHRGM